MRKYLILSLFFLSGLAQSQIKVQDLPHINKIKSSLNYYYTIVDTLGTHGTRIMRIDSFASAAISSGGGATGSGTVSFIPQWTDSSALGNSPWKTAATSQFTYNANGNYIDFNSSSGIGLSGSGNGINITSDVLKVGSGSVLSNELLSITKNQNGQTWIAISNPNSGSGSAVGLAAQSSSADINIFAEGSGWTTNGIRVQNQSDLSCDNNFNFGVSGNHYLRFWSNGAERARIDGAGNVLLHNWGSVMSSSATNGFVYLSDCNGTPTGTPAVNPPGQIPIQIDSASGKMYGFFNSVWNTVGGLTYTADESTLHLSAGAFSIKSTYSGQTSITTLGTVTTGSLGSAITAVTQSANDNSTKISTTAYADRASNNAVTQPLNQIVYGTGSGITSDTSFKWNNTNKVLQIYDSVGTQHFDFIFRGRGYAFNTFYNWLPYHYSNTFGGFVISNNIHGGFEAWGYSDGSAGQPISLTGMFNSSHVGGGWAAITLRGGKNDGTGNYMNLAATDNLLDLTANGPGNVITAWRVKGDGSFSLGDSVTPAAMIEVKSSTKKQLRLTYTDGSVYTNLNTDAHNNLVISMPAFSDTIQESSNGIGIANGFHTGGAFWVNGRTYLGSNTAPNAIVNIGAGTTQVPPLVIGSGTINTSPQAGAIEYNGSHLYWTSSAPTRYQLDQQNNGSTGDLTSYSGTNIQSNIADVATGSVLVSGGVGVKPLWSATPVITTNLTVPSLFGSVGSTSGHLDLYSTGGIGATDYIRFLTGSQVEAGRFASNGTFVLGGTSQIASEQLSIQQNHNGLTEFLVQNTTAGASSQARGAFLSDVSAFYFGQRSTTTTAYGGIGTQYGYSYTNGPGMSLSCDNASGIINFCVGTTVPEIARITASGNIVLNGSGSAVAQSATSGYVYMPCVHNSIPTGTPANTYTGTVQVLFDDGSGMYTSNGTSNWSHQGFDATSATISASTSGTVIFNQVFHNGSYKRLMINLQAATGTASYTFPVAFVYTPAVVSTNQVAAGIVTSVSTTAVTVTGASTTGFIFLEGN